MVAFDTVSMEQREARLKAEREATARRDLRRWATVYSQRDELIHSAKAAGLGVNEITRLTGLAKTTVLRVLEGGGR